MIATKIKYILVTIFLVVTHMFVSAQVLRGVVTSNGFSVEKAYVYIFGIGQDITNSDGIYSIDLASCDFCVQNTTLTILVNSNYGSQIQKYTITEIGKVNAFPCNIDINQNSKRVIFGVVKDKSNGDFIEDINITPLIPENVERIKFEKTDKKGIFVIIVDKSLLQDNRKISFHCQDYTNKLYKDTVCDKIINDLTTYVSIELEKIDAISLQISGPIKTKIKVEEGDIIEIRASGKIQIEKDNASFFSHPFGLSVNNNPIVSKLKNESLYKDWNHMALIFKVWGMEEGRKGEEGEIWSVYLDPKDNKNKFLAPRDGYLEFGVNHIKAEYNVNNTTTGFYEVKIKITK